MEILKFENFINESISDSHAKIYNKYIRLAIQNKKNFVIFGSNDDLRELFSDIEMADLDRYLEIYGVDVEIEGVKNIDDSKLKKILGRIYQQKGVLHPDGTPRHNCLFLVNSDVDFKDVFRYFPLILNLTA